MAFGVSLPTAATFNTEFEIITSAIYAAADRPRPAPVTDDKHSTRTHFVYRIDIWTDDGKNILEHLAGLTGRPIGLRVTGGQRKDHAAPGGAGRGRQSAPNNAVTRVRVSRAFHKSPARWRQGLFRTIAQCLNLEH